MNPKTSQILIILLLIWNFSYCQNYVHYTTKEGLPSNHAYKIAQDAKGFIWFATDRGLVRYNGKEMRTFTTKDGLSSNDVWGIHPTPDGKVWFMSKSTKIGYIERDSVYVFESENKNESLYSNFTSQIHNEIILGNGKVYHKLVDNKWRTVLKNSGNSKIYIKHADISHLDGDVIKGSIAVLDKKNQTRRIVKVDELNVKHDRGQLTDSLFYWVDDYRYIILNLNTLQIYNRTFKEEVGLAKSKHVRINLVNNQLQISGEGFVGVFDKKFHLKNTFLIPKNLDAHFGLIDLMGNIWISTFSNGIYKIPKERRHIEYRLPKEKVTKIDVVNNNIIMSVQNKGFYKYVSKNKMVSPFIKTNSFLYGAKYINAIKTEYYLTNNETIRFKDSIRDRVYAFDKLSNIEAPKGLVYWDSHLYSNSYSGLHIIDLKNFNAEIQGFQFNLNQMDVFNDKLLLATSDGLKQFVNGESQNIHFENDTLKSPITNIHKISDTELLLNTNGFGSYITDLKTVHSLKGSEYLTVNNAFIEKDSIWLATNIGVLKYIPNEKGTLILEKKLDRSNGLPSNNINDILILNNNELIVCTNNGLAVLPKNYTFSSQLLDIYIEKVTYNQQIINSRDAVVEYKRNNSLIFWISSINFSDDYSKNTFHYKLNPIQNEWRISRSNVLNFNNLSPGNYSIIIKKDSLFKTYKFIVKPVWWQKIWVIGLAIALFLSILVYVLWFFIRLDQKKKNKKIAVEREFLSVQLEALRSQMNPHFVFNSLTAIQYFINHDSLEASEKYLVKFSKLIRSFFELSSENEISLNEEIELLQNYLEIEKMRFKNKLDFKINVSQKIDVSNSKIPTMLLQPIVENAVNHGLFNKLGNGLITINFRPINDISFLVEIIDDGIGFSNAKNKTNKSKKSSNILKDRLYFLNKSKDWNITYHNEGAFPQRQDKGNKSTFIIKYNHG